MIPIIGLSGPIGSGKDTMARLLTKAGFRRLKFADPLYAMCNAIDPVFDPDMHHSLKAAHLLNNTKLGTRRNFIEKLGTEFLRNTIAQEFFTLYMQQAIIESVTKAPSLAIVVSDVRFENEASLIRRLGGHVVHIKPQWDCDKTGHTSDQGIAFHEEDSILGATYGKPEKAYRELLAIIKEVYSSASNSASASN